LGEKKECFGTVCALHHSTPFVVLLKLKGNIQRWYICWSPN